MYIQHRQPSSSSLSSISSATIALIVCLVIIGISAVSGIVLFYFRCRRNNQAQVPISIDSSMPTMKITFLSPPSSTSSPIRMELVPASSGQLLHTECLPIHSGHSRHGLIESNGGNGGVCYRISTEDHRARSILSDDASLDEGDGDWNQVQSYEPFPPTLSPDNRRYNSSEHNTVKGMNGPLSALGLETGPDLSRTMSLSSGSIYTHHPSQQLEDSLHHVRRHMAHPGFTRSVSFGAYGGSMARPQLSPSHSYNYSYQPYGTPSFYRFTSAPPQVSPVSSEASLPIFHPSSPLTSYRRSTIPRHQRSLSLPGASPFTVSSPLMNSVSHFTGDTSSPISPPLPTVRRATSNTIPSLLRQTKEMEFEPLESEAFTDGYFDGHHRRSIEHSLENQLSGESLINSRLSSMTINGLNQESGSVWDHRRVRYSKDFSQEREEVGRFQDREERLPPGYEQSEESFNSSIMV